MYKGQADSIGLSGIGIYRKLDPPGNFGAPIHCDARWDDSPTPVPVIFNTAEFDRALSPDTAIYAFPFHDNCWQLLEKVFSPLRVPHVRLFEFCAAVPYSLDRLVVSWGHDFYVNIVTPSQGLLGIYPWESKTTAKKLALGHHHLLHNFFDSKDSAKILALPAIEPPGAPISPDQCAKKDRFVVLPLEIRCQIASLLSTGDYLALRKASPAFVMVYYMQSFWATRFKQGETRSYFFEAASVTGEVNWQSLFKRTATYPFSFAMKNRIRVWKVVQELSDALLNIRELPELPFVSLKTDQATSSSPLKLSCSLWLRKTYENWSNGEEGAFLLATQSLDVPDDLEEMKFFYTNLGGHQLIVGLSTLSRSGWLQSAGYSSPDYLTIEVGCRPVIGLLMGVSARGFPSLEAFTTGFKKMGGLKHLACPKTYRLMGQTRITRITVGFDVSGFVAWQLTLAYLVSNAPQTFKLTQLEITREPVMGCDTPRKWMDSESTRRSAALWYPGPPPSHVFVEEAHGLGFSERLESYHPHVWTLFGGNHGINLKYLTGIRVIYSSGLERLEFVFVQKGRSFTKCFPPSRGNLLPGEHSGFFKVNGAGGERIVGIRAYRGNSFPLWQHIDHESDRQIIAIGVSIIVSTKHMW